MPRRCNDGEAVEAPQAAASSRAQRSAMGLISVAYAAVSSDMVAIPLSAGFGRVALHGDRESRPRLWAEAALIAAVAYHNGLAVLGGNGAGPSWCTLAHISLLASGSSDCRCVTSWL